MFEHKQQVNYSGAAQTPLCRLTRTDCFLTAARRSDKSVVCKMSDHQHESSEPATKRAKVEKLTDSQNEILIRQVQRRQVLWNDQHENFKNSTVTRKLWNEVGAALEIPGDEAKKKWKNLKDKYRKLMQKPPPKSGSGAIPPKPKWRFFDSMLFTKDTITPAQMVGCLTKKEDQDEDDIEDSLLAEVSTFKNATNPIDSTAANSNFARPHRPKSEIASKYSLEKEMLQLEKQKINAILNMHKKNENEEGDDYFFLMSLLPYIKPLDPLVKLELRGKIQTAVMDSFRINQQHQGSSQRGLQLFERQSTTLSEVSNDMASPSLSDHRQSSNTSNHYQANQQTPELE